MKGDAKNAPHTSKVNLPYEMLISKLIDGLEVPELIMNKSLPLPDQPTASTEPSAVVQQAPPAPVKVEKQVADAPGVFSAKYTRQATASSAPEHTIETPAPRQLLSSAKLQDQHLDKVVQMPQAAAPFVFKAPQPVQVIQMPLQPQIFQPITAQPICYQIPSMAAPGQPAQA